TAGAAETDIQAGEAALDIIFDGNVHDAVHAVQEFGHPGLLFEVILHRLVPAGLGLEVRNAAGVQDAAAVKNESAPIAGFVRRYTAPVGEAPDMDDEGRSLVGLHRLKPGDHFIPDHQPEQAVEFRQGYARVAVLEEPFQVAQCQRDADQEMSFSLKKAAEAVGAKDLEKPDQHIAVVLVHEFRPVDLLAEQPFHAVDIMLQQRVFPGVGQFRLRLPEQGSYVILECAFHPALEIDEMDMSVLQEDIAALEVAEQKVPVVRMRQPGAEIVKVIDQQFLVIGDTERVEEIVLEIQEVAEDRLLPELARGDRLPVIQARIPADLQPGQLFQALAEHRIDGVVVALFFQLAKEGGVAEVFLEIDRAVVVYKIDLRHRTSLLPEMPAEIDKGLVFLYIVIVCGDTGTLRRADAKIDAVAAGLGDNVQPGDRVAAVVRKKFSDLLDDGLHRYLGRSTGPLRPVKVR